MKQLAKPNNLAWRGAIIGAIVLGATGLASGIALCLYLGLPIPPIFITEMGILVGGCLGALIGYSCAFEGMREAWLGLLLGALSGIICYGPGLLAATLALIGGAVGWQAHTPTRADEWETV